MREAREGTVEQQLVEGELALGQARTDAQHTQALLELERVRLRAAVENEASPASLQGRLIDALPEIVAKLPKPDELRAVTIGGRDGHTVAGLIAELGAVVGALRSVTAAPPADG